jgi:hypothetical protein
MNQERDVEIGQKLTQHHDLRRHTAAQPTTIQAILRCRSRNLSSNGICPPASSRPNGKARGQPKLSVEDHLLVALEYWREYRTQFHLAQSWGIHEASVCRIVRKVEDHLIRSGGFSFPGKRQLIQSEQPWDVVVIDVSETPIERPKKTAPLLQR